MRIARVLFGDRVHYAVLEGDTARLLAASPFEDPNAISKGMGEAPLAGCRLLAPCAPGKAVCVGLNYADHSRKGDDGAPAEPVFFMKPPTAVLDPLGVIDYPPETSNLQYEAELAVVIGRRAHRITAAQAAEHVLGYTCANDVTARDLQKSDGQWTRAKSFDTFLPLGPWIETEFCPDAVDIRLLLNGQVTQSSNTRCMIRTAGELVAAASRVMTLLPGDVILTGTPGGMTSMQVGDTVTVEIAGIGALTNTVGIVP